MTGESSKDLLRFSSARENKVISRTSTFELNKSDKQMTLKPNDNVKTNINEKFIDTIEETSEEIEINKNDVIPGNMRQRILNAEGTNKVEMKKIDEKNSSHIVNDMANEKIDEKTQSQADKLNDVNHISKPIGNNKGDDEDKADTL